MCCMTGMTSPVLQRLESTDFDEKKEINKRKQLILEGKVKFFLFLKSASQDETAQLFGCIVKPIDT